MVLSFSLIHPSRSRPEKAREIYNYWMSKASGENKIEHILSLDFSDPLNEHYGMVDGKYIPFGDNSKSIIDHNSCVVEATNQAAKMATGDVLIYLSDDFKCPDNWDRLIAERMLIGHPTLLKVNDCLQQFEVAVLTIPIMNRSLYEKLGYFWHPSYRSMFVDEDLYWTCKNNIWMVSAPELQFPHEHCSIGKAERDETYIRSEANWDHGKAIFAERKALNFPLK
jgi:hypothetical protein